MGISGKGRAAAACFREEPREDQRQERGGVGPADPGQGVVDHLPPQVPSSRAWEEGRDPEEACRPGAERQTGGRSEEAQAAARER